MKRKGHEVNEGIDRKVMGTLSHEDDKNLYCVRTFRLY